MHFDLIVLAFCPHYIDTFIPENVACLGESSLSRVDVSENAGLIFWNGLEQTEKNIHFHVLFGHFSVDGNHH